MAGDYSVPTSSTTSGSLWQVTTQCLLVVLLAFLQLEPPSLSLPVTVARAGATALGPRAGRARASDRRHGDSDETCKLELEAKRAGEATVTGTGTGPGAIGRGRNLNLATARALDVSFKLLR